LIQSIVDDSREVSDIFALDTKLNIGSAYLRPSFTFGGSCFPKDVRASHYYARRHDVHAPVIESVLPSNTDHIQRAFDTVRRTASAASASSGWRSRPVSTISARTRWWS
jgi:GDP-mannose 6-dehydrogenase